MDDNRSPFFPPEALAQIRKGKVFSGGIRHKEIVGPLLPAGAEWISITVPLDRVFSRYEEIFTRFEETATDNSIIVFASGDPLFFGFANTIKRKASRGRHSALSRFQFLADIGTPPRHAV